MCEDELGRLFAQCYGLALGLALGAFVTMVPLDWRAAAATACWAGQAEAGQISDRSCGAIETAGAGDLGAVALAASLPREIDTMR